MPRGRKPKETPSPFNSITIEEWQRSPVLVDWARSEPTFAMAISAIQNGMEAIDPADFDGYRKAFRVLLRMRVPVEQPKPLPPANYSEPAEEFRDESLD